MITNKLYKIIGIECEHNDDFVRVRYYDPLMKDKDDDGIYTTNIKITSKN